MPSNTVGNSDLVLLVDEVPGTLAILHGALDESGYAVVTASSVEQALQRVAQAPSDIVLLDDSITPGIDGVEVARRLKADARTTHIPIIFMTASTETEHLVAALEAGCVDQIIKPIKLGGVLARMNVHLHGARRARQHARQAGRARNALDAFGNASIVIRLPEGRLIRETSLARELLLRYCGTSAPQTPAVVLSVASRSRRGGESRHR